ncbi:MAG TPA: Spy/CpxP family protein refolding chaperone [Noviherbaspirillum sp.]
MTSIRKCLLIGFSAITLAAGACAAQAADNQQGPQGGMHDGRFAEHMKARMEKRAAEMHDKLHLNPSQETAWNAYIAKMKPANPPSRPDRAALDKMTAPERMEFMLARMKEHEQKMADRIAATKEFYAVLTPEQKKIFDDGFKGGMRHQHRG